MGVRLAIAGGGITGLSLAYILKQAGKFDVTLLEADRRAGGKIKSERLDGYILETGVPGFLDNKPKTIEMSKGLGLSPLKSNDASRKRFIYSAKKLRKLPETPLAFLMSGMISPIGKLRLMLEPFIRKSTAHEESLADFARRRLGREAFEKLIDPMASGIYAGDPETMSLKSCFPRIHEIEQIYGSLIKGMIKISAERKKTVGAAPGGRLASFENGMQALTDNASSALGSSLRLNSEVLGIEKKGSGYALFLSDGSKLDTDIAVIATPAHKACRILRDMDENLGCQLGSIPYSPISVVCTAFDAGKIGIPLDMFGFLVPSKEKRNILGSVFDSSTFPHRAPDGMALLRTLAGGARMPKIAELDDQRTTDTVLSELRDLAGIRSEPEFVKIYRHEKAIPQYLLGHSDRLEKINDALASHKGLYITGNAYRGIGVNDCIENSYKLAEKITREVYK